MNLLVVAIALMAALVLWVLWTEPRMLYDPARGLEATPSTLGWAFDEVELRAEDGVKLHGWFIPAPVDRSRSGLSPEAPPSERPTAPSPPGPEHHAERRRPVTVLLLHGNAGNISHRFEKLRIVRDLGVDLLIVDYRGYGLSEGRPSEVGLYRDARAAYDHLVTERRVDPREIVLYGESLGSAVAVHLAAEAEVGGVVLEAAFTSARDVAQAMFPLLPVRWLMRSRYDALGKIPRVRAPILVIHGREDEYFPLHHAERLVAAYGSRARLVVLRGDHNQAFLTSQDAYRRALEEFLSAVATARPPFPSPSPAGGPRSRRP